MGIAMDFNGIVRTTSAQNNAEWNGEEMIHMRHNGVCRMVGARKVVLDSDDSADVFAQEFDGLEQYWGRLLVRGGRVCVPVFRHRHGTGGKGW